MDPRKLHTTGGLDERLAARVCAYCGAVPDTVNHVPSKVLLDDPLPANLPVVHACASCNQGFSLDEEYLACFLECVLSGTAEAERIRRPKIERAVRHSAKLAEQLRSSSREATDGTVLWTPDAHRVENVLVKLARGHVAYELSSPQLDRPRSVLCLPFLAMTENDREIFERAGSGELRGWPEIGSRAFLRAAGAEPYDDQEGPWVEVQSGRYRYSVDEHGGVIVYIVLAEYLACTIEWE